VSPSSSKLLIAGVGDIHGRFHRVQEWIARLEEGRKRKVDAMFAVGDVEAFTQAEDHRRKASKRGMPAEFSEYAAGQARLARPLYFIGGNNEDFTPLHGMPEGGELAPNVHYLGRYGCRTLHGLKVAYLSGIYAPRHFDTPLLPPTSRETAKQAGYFRRPEVEALEALGGADLMLVHEWPKGLVTRPKGTQAPPLRAYRFPWIGNPVARQLVDRIRPAWLMAGHSHVPFAATVGHSDGSVTRVACLDQAAKPEASIFWVEWERGEAVRAGWGPTGEVHWQSGAPWSPAQTPVTSEPAEHDARM